MTAERSAVSGDEHRGIVGAVTHALEERTDNDRAELAGQSPKPRAGFAAQILSRLGPLLYRESRMGENFRQDDEVGLAAARFADQPLRLTQREPKARGLFHRHRYKLTQYELVSWIECQIGFFVSNGRQCTHVTRRRQDRSPQQLDASTP